MCELTGFDFNFVITGDTIAASPFHSIWKMLLKELSNLSIDVDCPSMFYHKGNAHLFQGITRYGTNNITKDCPSDVTKRMLFVDVFSLISHSCATDNPLLKTFISDYCFI